MPNPYSSDLRLRVARAVEAGKTTREVGEQFQVSSSFVSNMHRLWKTSGDVQGKQLGGFTFLDWKPAAQLCKII